MALLRQHAVELGRRALMEELQQFGGQRASMTTSQEKAVKDNLHARFRRLVPGAALGIRAILRPSGEITTRPEQIAAEL
eukprot:8033126-Lingulodinium_polyedra.AAC.1